MTTPQHIFGVGIDVSKDDFYACVLRGNHQGELKKCGLRKFANSPAGFDQFHEWLQKRVQAKAGLRILLEATGVYHERLAYFLYEHDYRLTVELPNKVKNFGRSLNQTGKTDAIDAAVIAQMAVERVGRAWQPCCDSARELRALTRQDQAIAEDMTAVNNRLHAARLVARPVAAVIDRYEQQYELLEEQREAIKTEIKLLRRADEALDVVLTRLETIPGVATRTAAVMAAELNNFQLFRTREQLVKFCGLDILDYESGSSVYRKSKVSKRGNARVRRALYMAAMEHMKKGRGTVFSRQYHRVYERLGIKTQARMAIMRKLLVVMFALIKNGTDYQADRHFAHQHSDPTKRVGEPELAYSDSMG